MTALVLEGLTAGHVRPAFEGVGFSVQTGEFVGLVGPNGAGKSTLLKAISGALRPMAGRVTIFGKDLAAYRARELSQRMALLPQLAPDDTAFKVEEVVAFGRHPYQHGWGWGDAAADRRVVLDAMQATGVEAWRDRRMGTLSGGEQQRVRLAQALAQDPEILLLDEPTAWADFGYQLELLRLVARLASERKLAVLAVLHDLNQAAQFCSRLLLLHHGRLMADGPPAETLTEDAIARAYGVPVHIRYHPETAAPYLLPRVVPGPQDRS